MSEIALELDEVLQQEYALTGGEELPSPDAKFTEDDVLDLNALITRFDIDKTRSDKKALVVKRLNELRATTDRDSPSHPLSLAGTLTAATKRLAAAYPEDEAWRLRINRRVLEDIYRDALRGAAAWPEITADQIVNVDSCRATLAGYGCAGSFPDEIAIARQLEKMRTCIRLEADCPPKRFADSARLDCNTTLLIADYQSFDDDDKRAINRRILDDVFADGMLRWRDVRLGRIYGELHKRKDEHARTALCISGGGIRSATFALGVIQGLAGTGLLKRFDFLSTVSGGGYIGSWLSSWIRRHPQGVHGVEKDLSAFDSKVARDGMAKLEPEAKPIRHLREYSNYLTPRLGITSGDTWAFIALYLRNLIVNLLILVPLIAVVLAIPRASAWVLKHVENLRIWALVLVSDLSLFALFGYIGFARPVQQGSHDTSGLPWLISRIPKGWRFILFCFGGGAGASIAITMTWAKWVSLGRVDRFDINGLSMGIGLALALVAAVIVPCAAYFYRYAMSSYAARRESIAAGGNGGNAAIRKRRIKAEIASAVVAAVAATGLCYFFADKVFDRPLAWLPEFFGVSPFILAKESLASPRLLFICFAAPTVLFILFLQATIFVVGSGRCNEDYDREWWGRAGGWLLAGSASWVLLSGISIFGPLAIYQFPAIVGALGGVSGLVAILLGRSPKSGAQKSDTASARSEKALGLAVPLFCIFLLAVIPWLTTVIIHKVEHTGLPNLNAESQLRSVVASRADAGVTGYPQYKETLRTKPIPYPSPGLLSSNKHLQTVEKTRAWHLFWIVLVGGIAFAASFAVGANRFSMHALYRNRLIRAYLGASRYDRDPNPLTGFDPYDNLEMYKLRPELLWRTSFTNFGELQRDLQVAVMDGRPQKLLSTKIAGMLQDTTKKMLIDDETLSAIVDRMEEAQRTASNRVIDICQDAVKNLESFLPRTVKRLAKAKIGKMDAVLSAARKDVAKRKQQMDLPTVVRDTVIQDLNRILIERDLTEETPGGLPRPQVKQCAAKNRAAFDRAYEGWVEPMPLISRTSPPPAKPTQWRAPLHIVNTALNLVGGHNLAWQQRMAESFTISPLHSGSAFVGYRDSREYGSRLHGISLGTAVTISGAAASPNQGYHSSIPLSFLLTMFNVRLGWWLGNPGAAGETRKSNGTINETWGSDNPSSTVALLAREIAGETNDTYRWIYLSDGGHFENLGLYEMVLRRCRYIVVSDGGCDPKFTFDDLGNAIRKIRMDLGIPITFEKMSMRGRDEDSAWSYVAVGTIDYKAVDGESANRGKLIYLKPGYYVDEKLPKDVMNYAKECPDFPHETTADQWFSESQFESYRALGHHVIEQIVSKPEFESLPQFESLSQFAAHVVKQTTELQQTEYVPVVAERITIKGDKGRTTAVVLPSKDQPRA